MYEHHLIHLVCPGCHGDLELAHVELRDAEHIREGMLRCTQCRADYPIIRSIPRFVPEDNYASSFGMQWNLHYRTQYDSYSGLPLSERRFFEETAWARDLEGERILEAGSGSGRFTEQAAKTGALVVSFDYSSAVEAGFQANGDKPNVLIAQADINKPPLRAAYFDKVFCFGVLQHTADPRRAFHALPPLLKSGGSLVVDVYKKNRLGAWFSFTPAPPTKYYVRPLTTRIEPQRLYRWIRRYIDLTWSLSRWIGLIPRIGRNINWMLLIADHRNLGLSDEVAKQWAYLNTFDMLAPRYDLPQRLETVREWFREANLHSSEIYYGYNGIVGRGRR